ncbi:MAG TPA: hypothetical protein VHE81_17985, partial [Lacipirellulaceae bacterium]|nr:hypothetical protein [Lacipirellulaceae bacterium]
IVGQLRRWQIDALTAQEDGSDRLGDEALLEHTNRLGRPIVTHDIRFLAMAENWQRIGHPFCGLIFARPLQVSIGQCMRDLKIIAKATDPADWKSVVLRLPL